MSCNFPLTLLRNGRHELVPCGACIPCLQRKRGDWSFRLLQELKTANKATFLTLTYNEKYIPKNYHLNKKDLTDYFKRVRSKEPTLKYYAVGEYGGKNERPHYHAIVFNCDNSILIDKWSKNVNGIMEPIGFVTTDPVNEATIHYVTGYILKKHGETDEKTGKAIPKISVDKDTGEIKNWSALDLRPFAQMSKGLGKIYLKHNTKFHKSKMTTETRKEGGIITNIPRYYRDKIFTEDEKKVLNEKLQEKMKKLQLSPAEGKQKREYEKLMLKNQQKRKKL